MNLNMFDCLRVGKYLAFWNPYTDPVPRAYMHMQLASLFHAMFEMMVWTYLQRVVRDSSTGIMFLSVLVVCNLCRFMLLFHAYACRVPMEILSGSA